MKSADETVKVAYQDTNPNRGYGGKFGTEKVMDKVSAFPSLYLFNRSAEHHKRQLNVYLERG